MTAPRERLPTQVPAKEFARKIGQYQRQALVQPITITSNGQPSLVLLNVDEYRRLKRRDREVFDVRNLTPEQAGELLEALELSRQEVSRQDPETDRYAHELDGWTP
jgi:prevent-host-death family protein